MQPLNIASAQEAATLLVVCCVFYAFVFIAFKRRLKQDEEDAYQDIKRKKLVDFDAYSDYNPN